MQLVNIDAVDQPATNAPETPERWVNITTTRENRFATVGVADRAIESDIVFKDFDVLHAELKVLLSEVITRDLTTKIYLTDQKQ